MTEPYYDFREFSEGNCPDTLAWDPDLQTCLVECIFPLYSEEFHSAVLITCQILGCISFLVCYFYCFTALFRPLMLRFPNSNIFFFHISLMMSSCSYLIPLFLGTRYVACDSNTEIGSSNWACVLSGVLFEYGSTSALSWFCVIHITLVARIYLITLPKYTSWVFFIICYGTWSLVVVVVGFALDYNVFLPGSPVCFLGGNSTFSYISFLSYFYAIVIVSFVCACVITLRIIQVKKRSKVPWMAIVRKQFRIYGFWAYFVLVVTFQTLVIATFQVDRDEIRQSFIDYIHCVILRGARHCTLTSEKPHEIVAFLTWVSWAAFPLVSFIVFGLKQDNFLFWKEYFSYCVKNKTLTLSFVPSFDPSMSSSSSIQSIDEAVELRKRIREL